LGQPLPRGLRRIGGFRSGETQLPLHVAAYIFGAPIGAGYQSEGGLSNDREGGASATANAHRRAA
jgi:hypothetical protein